MAMLDLDELRTINQNEGFTSGNRVVELLIETVTATSSSPVQAALYHGKQVLLFFPQSDSEAASLRVEEIRQQIEQVHFCHQESEFQATLSGAVVSLDSASPWSEVFDQLEKTLEQAKQDGRNCTFLWENGEAIPIDPPKLEISPQRIELTAPVASPATAT